MPLRRQIRLQDRIRQRHDQDQRLIHVRPLHLPLPQVPVGRHLAIGALHIPPVAPPLVDHLSFPGGPAGQQTLIGDGSFR